MENLSISEPPPQQGGGPGIAAPAQLPPQMFTTAAQLLDLTDKKLMVVLRDGRKLVGVLRSWDQFANIVLQSTTERLFALQPPQPSDAAPSDTAPPRGLYADILHGIFLVRGENVLLLGEMDLDRDDLPPPGYEQGEVALVKRLADEARARDRSRDKARARKLAKLGFEGDAAGEIVLL
ncbi:small nuclear ribonucleoprotein (LSM1), putative [Cordyceps militaris CM01]|uniref:U6 snRNA-associated Sm-like protein LSm1 n=2 Tax=Cordyceps militaris TaxID=73501 RepID=G3J9W4_CORMM|nr:small nuclear ribonucleoprotein (LSM1), putative [Cordyceps militaris CM01]ATY60967.1 small nuclear ribonucleo (LSM1) [Cordyceps militaris]EGX94187.1 small nuclear ribonucleoprotein (LSM1), putative [Cordyceps militaris CM01]